MDGPDGFTAGLAAYRTASATIDRYIVYTVEVVEGRFAGQLVETAVAIDEVGRWPLVPPHQPAPHPAAWRPADCGRPHHHADPSPDQAHWLRPQAAVETYGERPSGTLQAERLGTSARISPRSDILTCRER